LAEVAQAQCRFAQTLKKKGREAVVVDLPFVPVIATTRDRSMSWSQRFSDDVTVTP